MPKFLIVICIYVYLLLLLYCGALVRCPGVAKNKTRVSQSLSAWVMFWILLLP